MRINGLPFIVTLALLVQATPALRAADVIVGGQVGVAAPASAFKGTMSDGRGLGGGLHLLVAANDLIAYRTKAEYWEFRSLPHNGASSPRNGAFTVRPFR